MTENNREDTTLEIEPRIGGLTRVDVSWLKGVPRVWLEVESYEHPGKTAPVALEPAEACLIGEALISAARDVERKSTEARS